jgi:hypothetical protein
LAVGVRNRRSEVRILSGALPEGPISSDLPRGWGRCTQLCKGPGSTLGSTGEAGARRSAGTRSEVQRGVEARSELVGRPQRTNGDALVVGLAGAAIFAISVYGLGKLLAVANLVDFGSSSQGGLPRYSPAQLSALVFFFRRTVHGLQDRVGTLSDEVGRLEARTSDLGASEPYSEHIRETLDDLRKVVYGQLPGFSLRDFLEKGLFERTPSGFWCAMGLEATSGSRSSMSTGMTSSCPGARICTRPLATAWILDRTSDS